MNSMDVIKALRKRHGTAGREWALFEELRAGTGYKNRKKGFNPEQRFDAFALNLYPSKGNYSIAYEIKVSRSDFLHEIKHPEKRQQALSVSNEFYFVTPKGLVKKEEIPPECGLIEVNADLSSRIVIKAPFREKRELSWNFLASIARRAVL